MRAPGSGARADGARTHGRVAGSFEEEIPDRFYDGRLMRRLLTCLRPHRTLVVWAALCLMVSALLQVAGPLLVKTAIDRYIAPIPGPAPGMLDRWLPSDRRVGIASISGIYLSLLALTAVFDVVHAYLMQRVGQRAMSDLRRQVMARLQALDVEFFDHNPVGRLVTRATTDIDALSELFTSGLISIVGDVLMLVFVAAAMFRMNVPLTVLVLAVMPGVVFATMRFRRAASAGYRLVRVTVARLNAYLQEHISGMTVVQLFNAEGRSAARFDAVNAENRTAYKDALFASSWFNPVVEFQGVVAVAAVLAMGGFLARRGAVSLGVLVAFLQYALRFFRPIQELSDKYNVLQSAVAASEKVFTLLDTPVRVGSPRLPVATTDGAATIEFDHVWFAYKDEDWVLRDVSFTIAPGESVAVVGHTGAGKTTLISLLLRFYDVQRGGIRVGGVDVRDVDPTELRRRFGVVLQDAHLFAGTIADNIRLGSPDLTDEQLLDSVDRVNLAELVESLPGGLAATVHERGSGLSAGQKQLIAFARAWARNPAYLVLDEATSSVDTATERRLEAARDTILAGRTTIIIAHRLSTIRRADTILVMHKGELCEQGTHEQLLAGRGLYWRLHRLQYSSGAPAAPDAPRPADEAAASWVALLP